MRRPEPGVPSLHPGGPRTNPVFTDPRRRHKSRRQRSRAIHSNSTTHRRYARWPRRLPISEATPRMLVFDPAATTETQAPTTHQGILDFVSEVASMTRPDSIHWCTGSDEEWTELTHALESTGTFTRLNPAIKPNSFYAASDPIDVARVEDRTYICSVDEKDCGPTNNWMDPNEMKAIMRKLYAGCMRGRTMYVIPFVMGHLEAEKPMFGVEITDSAYVTASMRVMARMGTHVQEKMEELAAAGEDFHWVPALHSVGMPLEEGQDDVAWPCNDTKYIVQFPEERMIWSYGSGYGGNALLGKKCYALRIASVMARDEGWLAEHMLILKLTSPEGV